MKGASMACQFGGKPGGAGGGLSGRFLVAKEYRRVSSVDNLPVLRSSFRILIPFQKLPNASHACPSESRIRLGSMALKSSLALDCSTSPSSTQWNCGLFGSRVLLVSRAMPEVFLPNAEKA